MNITPLEIRQKDFEKKLRGYDKDEVNAFLQSLSNEWERVLEENKELNIKLDQAQKEVSKLREVESSLYKTLKTAEDTGANVIDQANKAAELHMKETKMNAEALLSESKNKARAMIEQAEMEARQIIEELQDAVKSIEQNHREIENHRQMAIQELKNLSVTLIEKVERNTQGSKEFRFDDYVKRVKKLARESEERIKAEKTVVSAEDAKVTSLKAEDIVKEEIQEKPQSTPPASVSLPQEPVQKEESEKELASKKFTKQEPSSEISVKKEVSEAPVEQKETENVKAPDLKPAKTPEKDEKKSAPQEDSKEEKKGPRISRTVSFFDELDTDN